MTDENKALYRPISLCESALVPFSYGIYLMPCCTNWTFKKQVLAILVQFQHRHYRVVFNSKFSLEWLWDYQWLCSAWLEHRCQFAHPNRTLGPITGFAGHDSRKGTGPSITVWESVDAALLKKTEGELQSCAPCTNRGARWIDLPQELCCFLTSHTHRTSRKWPSIQMLTAALLSNIKGTLMAAASGAFAGENRKWLCEPNGRWADKMRTATGDWDRSEDMDGESERGSDRNEGKWLP